MLADFNNSKCKCVKVMCKMVIRYIVMQRKTKSRPCSFVRKKKNSRTQRALPTLRVMEFIIHFTNN